MSLRCLVVFSMLSLSLANSEMASPAPDDPAAAKEAQAPLLRDEWSPRERAQEQQRAPDVQFSPVMVLPWLVVLIAGALGVFFLKPGRKASKPLRSAEELLSADDWPARKAAAKGKASVEGLDPREAKMKAATEKLQGFFAGAAFDAWARATAEKSVKVEAATERLNGFFAGAAFSAWARAVADEKAEAEEKARIEAEAAAAEAKRAADQKNPLKAVDEGLKNVGKAFAAMGDSTKELFANMPWSPKKDQAKSSPKKVEAKS